MAPPVLEPGTFSVRRMGEVPDAQPTGLSRRRSARDLRGKEAAKHGRNKFGAAQNPRSKWSSLPQWGRPVGARANFPGETEKNSRGVVSYLPQNPQNGFLF